jgi:hypothetical protein
MQQDSGRQSSDPWWRPRSAPSRPRLRPETGTGKSRQRSQWRSAVYVPRAFGIPPIGSSTGVANQRAARPVAATLVTRLDACGLASTFAAVGTRVRRAPASAGSRKARHGIVPIHDNLSGGTACWAQCCAIRRERPVRHQRSVRRISGVRHRACVARRRRVRRRRAVVGNRRVAGRSVSHRIGYRGGVTPTAARHEYPSAPQDRPNRARLHG